MLVSNETISTRYGKGLEYLADLSYGRFLREWYAMQVHVTYAGEKLLLLLFALNKWDNRQGAENDYTELQLLHIMENISQLKQSNPMGSAYASGVTSGNGGTVPFIVRDTQSIDFTLAANQLEAAVKLSQQGGNILQQNSDGLFATADGGNEISLLVSGADFANATRYNNLNIDTNKKVIVIHRGLGELFYKHGDPGNPLNEYEILSGAINITIPGFNVNEGVNYFIIKISEQAP